MRKKNTVRLSIEQICFMNFQRKVNTFSQIIRVDREQEIVSFYNFINILNYRLFTFTLPDSTIALLKDK